MENFVDKAHDKDPWVVEFSLISVEATVDMNPEHRTLNTEHSLLRVWFLAARPKTLWAGIAPVLMGSALAYSAGGFHAGAAVAALLGALLIQVGTNFCNDYADFKKGADTQDRVGPVRVTQAGWVAPEAMLRATVLVFLAAALVGVYLVLRGGWPMFWIAAFSILLGVAYTAGPFALAYLGLGDVFVLIFFGPIAVGGTYYVQTLEWPLYVTMAGLAPGLLSCAVLAVNNLRDLDQDRAAGKRTLAVRFGRSFARAEYVFCVCAACLAVPIILWLGFAMTPAILLSVAALPVGVPSMKAVLSVRAGPTLNPVLGRTAFLLLIFALLFTSGLFLGTLLV